MADRNFQKKKRNEIKRKTKPIMLITAEGKNKTEKIYENIEDNPYIYEQSKDKLLSMMGYHEATFSDMNYKLIYRIEEDTIFEMGVFNDLQDHVKKLL